MKTFFHPPAIIEENALVPRLLNKGGRLARVAASRIRSLPPKKMLASLGGAGLLALVLSIQGDEMPGLGEEARKQLPEAVEEAAREVFDQRFVKHGDSYYSIMVTYVPDVFAEIEKEMPGYAKMMSGMTGEDFQISNAPLVLSMDLIELKQLKTTVEPEDLHQADVLNSISWKGRVQVSAEAERRRQLDLKGWIRSMAESEGESSLPYLAQEIPFAERELLLKALQSEPASEVEDDNPMAAMGIFGMLFGGNMTDQLVTLLEQDEWTDWSPCGDACYQNSHITERGDEVIVSTLESVDDAVSEDSGVTLMLLRSGFMQLGAMSGENHEVFLGKPVLKELK